MDERWRPDAVEAGPWAALAVLLAAIFVGAFGLGVLAYGLGWVAHAVRGALS